MKPEIYWINSPLPGKLAIMPRPRGGEWLRDEVKAWKDAGLDTIVCMLTTEEIAELDLAEEAFIAGRTGLEFIPFPVADREVPPSRLTALKLVHQLAKKLNAGHGVGIHCRMGLGRSALIAASILVHSGVDPEAAFRHIAEARHYSVPDTAEQRNWVFQLAEELQKADV